MVTHAEQDSQVDAPAPTDGAIAKAEGAARPRLVFICGRCQAPSKNLALFVEHIRECHVRYSRMEHP